MGSACQGAVRDQPANPRAGEAGGRSQRSAWEGPEVCTGLGLEVGVGVEGWAGHLYHAEQLGAT